MLAPLGVLADDDGDPGVIMTEQSLWGCESYYVCGQPGLDRWTIDLTVGGVGDLNLLTDERIDPVHGSHIRGVARAQFGQLGVSAFVDPPESFYRGGPDQAEMRANTKYEDVLTVLGTPGAPDVPISFTQLLSGFVDPPFQAPFGAGFASLQTRVFLGGFDVGAPVVQLGNTSASPLVPKTSVVVVPVGTELFVRQTLSVLAIAGAGSPPLSSVWLDTGVLHLDVGVAGYSISSASGHDYSTPVPEAGTAAMLACGLILLSGVRRLRFRAGGGTLSGSGPSIRSTTPTAARASPETDSCTTRLTV
jgi:hypothetical protein